MVMKKKTLFVWGVSITPIIIIYKHSYQQHIANYLIYNGGM
jgi:hypothetical protein